MKRFVCISIIFLLFSCEYLDLRKKDTSIKKPIASVYNSKLFKEDLASLYPKGISKKDSLILAKDLIETWAVKQLLSVKAVENSSLKENENIELLVQNYKKSLLINSYKEKLIKQQLDTIVSEKEMSIFYKKNQQNFKLNEELIKIKFLYIAKTRIDKKEVIELFKSDKIDDAELLEEQQISFKTFHLNDSIWQRLDNVLLKIPFSKGKLLKKPKYIQKVDSLGVYLASVKNVLKRNDVAPLSHIQSTIKQLILHKRKLQLIRDIEKIILQDAVQNKTFAIY